MTIQNLSGSIQPPTADKGSKLPQPSSSTPSVADNNVKQLSDAVQIKANLSREDVASSNEQADAINEIEEFKNFSQSINRSLQFKVDDELGVTIVRVIDKDTDELIRQFPPEDLINLSKRLRALNEEASLSQGVLLQEKV